MAGEAFGGRPGEGEAVVGAGAAPDFVHDDQAVRVGVVQDVGGFGHFDHEGGAATGEVVARADAGVDAAQVADARAFGRDVAARAGEDEDERRLAHIGAFAAHVGAGDDVQLAAFVEVEVVGDEGFAQVLFDHGVAALFDV